VDNEKSESDNDSQIESEIQISRVEEHGFQTDESMLQPIKDEVISEKDDKEKVLKEGVKRLWDGKTFKVSLRMDDMTTTVYEGESDSEKNVYIITFYDNNDDHSYELGIKFGQVKTIFNNDHSNQYTFAEFRKVLTKNPRLFDKLIDSIDFSPSTGELYMDVNHFKNLLLMHSSVKLKP
jgi:hypothetical protein